MICGCFYPSPYLVFHGVKTFPMTRSIKFIISQTFDIAPVEQKVFGIKKVNEFVEPFNEQAICVLAAYFQAELQFIFDTFGLSDQTEQTQSSVGKKLFDICPVDDDAYVGSVVNRFESLFHSSNVHYTKTPITSPFMPARFALGSICCYNQCCGQQRAFLPVRHSIWQIVNYLVLLKWQ